MVQVLEARIEQVVQLASMHQNLGWGLVFVTSLGPDEDDGLPDAFPKDDEENQPAHISSDAATVIRVQHGSDGDVTVRLWVGLDEWGRHGSIELGVTRISVLSGQLTVSDVLRERFVTVDVPPGIYRLQVNGDVLNNPAEIDLVFVDLCSD